MYNIPKRLKKVFNSNRPSMVRTQLLYQEYTGKIINMFESAGSMFYRLNWSDCKPVNEEGNSLVEDVVEFMGDYITKEEWELILEPHSCGDCGGDLPFVDGHVALDDDYIVCSVCSTKEINDLSKQLC